MATLRSVLSNAGWNLLGNLLPMLAGILAIPFLIDHLGKERFGLLSLAWILIGYFGLFDFGLGRALTRLVAQQARAGQGATLDALGSTGVALAALAGLAGGALVALGAGVLPGRLAQWPEALSGEARAALLWVALGVLPTVVAAALRGILEGLHRFKALNIVRVPAGVLLFAAPCLSAVWTPRLDVAVAALVVTRWLFALALWALTVQDLRLRRAAIDLPQWFAPMLRFGGWLTVSNVVGPLIVYLDRFVIGALLPPARLAYYVAPFEMVSRLLVVPSSFTAALFPALSHAITGVAPSARAEAVQQARSLRRRALLFIAPVVGFFCVVGIAVAHPLLAIWLGVDFADEGQQVARILLAGFFFNAIAQVPMIGMQGYGLSRQTALLHLTELPLYIALLYLMVTGFGLEGAAWAWTLRGAVDLAALAWLLRRAERQALIPGEEGVPVHG